MGDSSDFLDSDIGRSLLPILSDAGFEQGDFLPLYNFNPNAARGATFTSTTYTYNDDVSIAKVRWDKLFPSGPTPQIFGQIGWVLPGTDESVSVRIQNITDGETVGEVTGITGSNQIVVIEPVTYTPPTTSAKCMFRWEWKTDPGANSSEVRCPFITFGVKL